MAILVFDKIVKNKIVTVKQLKLKNSQSHIHSMMAPVLPLLEILEKIKPKPTQASEHLRKQMVRVLVSEGYAYWIKENVVYSAEVIDDEIDSNHAKVVDIMAMDDIELKRITFIIEKLTEGAEDDRGDTSNKNL